MTVCANITKLDIATKESRFSIGEIVTGPSNLVSVVTGLRVRSNSWEYAITNEHGTLWRDESQLLACNASEGVAANLQKLFSTDAWLPTHYALYHVMSVARRGGKRVPPVAEFQTLSEVYDYLKALTYSALEMEVDGTLYRLWNLVREVDEILDEVGKMADKPFMDFGMGSGMLTREGLIRLVARREDASQLVVQVAIEVDRA